jgi:hypothetical protein
MGSLSFLDQNQSNVQELKTEIHHLKDDIHRLNAALSDYQVMHPPSTMKVSNVCRQ